MWDGEWWGGTWIACLGKRELPALQRVSKRFRGLIKTVGGVILQETSEFCIKKRQCAMWTLRGYILLNILAEFGRAFCWKLLFPSKTCRAAASSQHLIMLYPSLACPYPFVLLRSLSCSSALGAGCLCFVGHDLVSPRCPGLLIPCKVALGDRATVYFGQGDWISQRKRGKHSSFSIWQKMWRACMSPNYDMEGAFTIWLFSGVIISIYFILSLNVYFGKGVLHKPYKKHLLQQLGSISHFSNSANFHPSDKPFSSFQPPPLSDNIELILPTQLDKACHPSLVTIQNHQWPTSGI